MYRVWGFLAEYSLLLILGALIALVWANIDPYGYHHFVETPLLFNDWVGADYKYWIKAYGEGAEALLPAEPTKRVLSLHYLVNDVLMALFFLGNSCLGLVIAPTMVMALEEHGEHAGMASSLGGTMQMVAGGLMILICSPFFDRTPLPLVGAVAACAFIAFVLALVTLRPQPEGNAPA